MSAIEIVMERKARVRAVRREGGVVGVRFVMEKRNARGAFRRRRVMKEDGETYEREERMFAASMQRSMSSWLRQSISLA